MKIFKTSSLPLDFRRRHRNRLTHRVRGFGFWIWKPQVILRHLQEIPEQSFLVYLDVGCHLNLEEIDGIWRYVETVRNSESGILCSALPFREGDWSKGDLLDFLAVKNQPDIVDSPQRQAGVLFLQKRPNVEAFVQTWLRYAEEFPHLLDDSPSSSENLEGFVEHRHDQSLFSVLSKLEGASTFSSVELEQWSLPLRERLEGSYPIEVRRNRGFSFAKPRLSKIEKLLRRQNGLLRKRID